MARFPYIHAKLQFLLKQQSMQQLSHAEGKLWLGCQNMFLRDNHKMVTM